jgi:hypothetical protein
MGPLTLEDLLGVRVPSQLGAHDPTRPESGV